MEDNKKDRNKNKILLSVLTIILIVILAIISYFLIFNKDTQQEEKELAYTELIKKVTDGEIEKIEMTVGSTSVKVKQKNIEEEKTVLVPNTQAFIELVQQKVAEGNEIELIQKPKNTFTQILTVLISFFPTLIMIALFIMIYKMQGLGGEKGKVYDADTKNTKIKFKDVAGLEEEKQEMIEIVDFLKHPKKFYEMGAKVPRGV